MLNNNLHVAHHDEPWVPWYDYRDVVSRVRAVDRAQEAGLLYEGGYAEVFRRFGIRPMDHPVQGGV
jgi:fatty acid desaturase